jgi:putative ABC transport system permease protein
VNFVLRMAARELRAAWRRLLFFFICVAIGVAAIVALRSIMQSVRHGLRAEARAMLAADVLVQTNRPWTPEVRAAVAERLEDAAVLSQSESIETATMVRAEKGAAVARMAELRGVAPEYPYYGTLRLSGDVAYAHALVSGRGALVGPDLLIQLGIAVGDRIMIGGQPFTVRGVIAHEPGRGVGAFSLGSRVIVDVADLRASGLLAFGSRASYQILLKVREEAVQRLADELRARFRDNFVGVRSYKRTEDNIDESFQRSENFLSLVGFAIVVLGGIGVWSVTRVFVRQKIRSVAILKCLGASQRQVLGTYVTQVALLGFLGSLLGVVIAAVAIASIPKSLVASIGGFEYGLTFSAVWQGMAVGILVALLFALVPLLEVRRIKPLLLLRGTDASAESSVRLTAEPTEPLAAAPATSAFRRTITLTLIPTLREYLRTRDWTQIGTAAVVSALLVVIASWQAASWLVGGIVSGGFAIVAAVLYGAAYVLVRAVMPLSSARWFPLRHAVISLRRPGNQTRVILLAVGLGSFFVLGVRALQDNLLAEFAVNFDRRGADMFLIDVQRDQVERVRALIEERADRDAPAPRLVPVLRARVVGVKGSETTLENYSDVRGRGSLAREYVITYRDHLERNERIVEGEFWEGKPALPSEGMQEVSVEEGIHERFRINPGDTMRFDVLGRTIEARVTSIRHVDWEDSRSGGFMYVFRPGAFAQAPHTFIGFLRGPADPTARARFQHDLVSRYPNVTAIDGRDILARIQRVIDSVVLGVSVVGGIALFSGILILVGAVAMTKFQRIYDAAILRTLGATTRLLTTMLALEYCALGLLAGLIGAGGALGLSWAVATYLLEIDWRPAPLLLSTGVLLTTALVSIVGVVSSLDVLRRKPLATLRAE